MFITTNVCDQYVTSATPSYCRWRRLNITRTRFWSTIMSAFAQLMIVLMISFWIFSIKQKYMISLTWTVQHDQLHMISSTWSVQHDQFNMISSTWSVQHDQFNMISSTWTVQRDQFNKISSTWSVQHKLFNMT